MEMHRGMIRVLAAGVAAVALGLGPAARSQEASPEASPDYKNPRLPVERRVADLLSRMTLEEKAAQTHAIWQQKASIVDEKGAFSPEKARTVLRHGIGQVTRPNERRGPRESAEFVNAIQRWVVENTRLGIPVMFHEEGLHGQQSPGGTNFPVPIALASSWDPALMHDVFSAVALEIRARGSQQVLAPVLDLARDPRWGRTEETYGEDPYLVSRLGVAVIKAYQGGAGPVIDGDHVMATAKHFAVHGQPEGGVNVAPANYSMRVVREYWLEPFRAAFLEAGAGAVMASYNEVDGVPSHANAWLLQDVLRGEWAFDGMVVSDYNGVKELESLHHVAADLRDAARQAITAGVDLELPDIDAYRDLDAQVREGLISEATLDRTVARILRAKFLTGLFESPYADPDRAARVVNSPEHQRLAERAARESMILLKNQNNLLGAEVAQLYVRDRVSSVTRPIKELKGFARVVLNPGETKTVTFAVTPESLAFYDRDMKRVVEPGMFDLMVGGSSAQLTTAQLEVVEP
jgi:beta-glucosidase